MQNYRFFKNPAYGIQCALKGLSLLRTPGLRRYVWIPIIINLVLFSLAYWVAGVYYSQFIDWLTPTWLDWLHWLLWPLLGLSLLLISVFSFTLIANLIASPFYGMLAVKSEKLILGLDPGSDETPWSRVIVSGVGSELKRVVYFLTRALPLLLLFIIPGINLIAPFVWLWFSAWFLALEYAAYPMAEYGLLFSDQRKILKQNRLGATAFGGIVMMGLAVPVLNLFVPPAAVIGATLLLANREKQYGG